MPTPTHYDVRLPPRHHSNLALKAIGRLLTPNQTYTFTAQDLQDPEAQRALKDGRLVVTREYTPPTQSHPNMYLTDKDWKKLEALTNRIIASIQQESKAIQDAIQQEKQILFDKVTHPRVRNQTRIDAPIGGLFMENPLPTPPLQRKKPPRPEAQYVATPKDQTANLQIEAVKAEGVSGTVEALRRLREGKDK